MSANDHHSTTAHSRTVLDAATDQSRNPAIPQSRNPLLRLFLLLAAVAALAAWQRPDGRLRVTFPATQGDAAIIATPAGGFVLIDGGADPAALTATLGRALPFWRRDLDAVVLTTADARRLPAQVAVLARYQTRLALAPPAPRENATLREWQRLLEGHRARVVPLRPGARLDLGGPLLTVLAADNRGALLRIDYGRTRLVFAHAPPGGAALDAASPDRPADLVVYPWRRDPRVSLAPLRPRAILFSDGDSGGEDVQLTYRERAVGGAQLYHEKLDGSVTWVSDGRRAWVESGK
jgi:hypothetical protein